MTQIELAMGERLMLVKYLTVLATETGETLEDARVQARQEIDRIVKKGDDLSLSGMKAEALSRMKAEEVKKQKAEEEAATAKKLADQYMERYEAGLSIIAAAQQARDAGDHSKAHRHLVKGIEELTDRKQKEDAVAKKKLEEQQAAAKKKLEEQEFNDFLQFFCAFVVLLVFLILGRGWIDATSSTQQAQDLAASQARELSASNALIRGIAVTVSLALTCVTLAMFDFGGSRFFWRSATGANRKVLCLEN